MTVSYAYPHQIGGIIVRPSDANNEYDYIISAKHHHGAGTVTYTMDRFEGEEVYRRNVPNTPEWKAQAFHDMQSVAQSFHPEEEIHSHEDDF